MGFVLFGAVYAFFKNTKYLPNAMSVRKLDPIKRGLRLAFFSWKLILLILPNQLHFFALVFIYRHNIENFEAY